MLLTEARLDQIIDLPVSLPVTKLSPLDWIIISTVEIRSGNKLTLSELQLQLAKIESVTAGDPCEGVGKNIVNPSFLIGSLGAVFFAKDFVPDTRPDLQPYLELLAAPTDFIDGPDAAAPIFVARTGIPLETTETGLYSIVAMNNSTNRYLHLTVNGTLTFDFAAIA